jgi:hypothetical protein
MSRARARRIMAVRRHAATVTIIAASGSTLTET